MTSCSKDEKKLILKDSLTIQLPDSNFESKLIELGVDTDGMVNQRMLRSDAEKVCRLDLGLPTSSGKITDLSGIEAFVNLTYLSVVGQELAEVDLSANVNLDTLFLYANQLTKLDVSHNTNLVLLDAQSNELSSIQGLANLPILKKVNLSFNSLEELTISNKSIEDLLISHNLLKSIDTKEALNLKNLFVIINELSTVDLRSNKFLETLIISGNKLGEISLEENSRLTHFFCSSNLLRNLDISFNHRLIDLRVDRNPDLTCIKVLDNQVIPSITTSDYQELNTDCN